MFRYLVLLLTFLAAILFIPGCDSGPKITPLPADAVVLAFGDSLTYGTGAEEEQAYPSVLESLLRRTVINVGIPGEVTAKGLKRLPQELEEHQPDMVILCHGGNDFLRHNNKKKTAANLRAMIELIREQGAEVVLIGVPELGFGLQVPEFYPLLAEEYAIPFEGEILINLLGDRKMKSDTIHPNSTGYRLMAEAIFELIDNAQRK
ncbi:MAG: arylesterase [Desulfuromonadales bacterium]|nr:arylesterase [Desulfuromonadales bacterium]